MRPVCPGFPPGARRVVTIHNNPENMALPARFRHLRFQCADVDTVDITQYFAPSYTFIEEGRAAGEGGVLESETLTTFSDICGVPADGCSGGWLGWALRVGAGHA